jgi:hypothetical protein
MTSRAVRAVAASSAALGIVAAGCGAGSEPLDRETAMQHAMNAVANQVADPGSSIYHHRIQLRTAVAYGKGGWLVRIADRTAGTRVCVTDLPRQTALGVTENISLGMCESPSGDAPSEPAPSSPPAA